MKKETLSGRLPLYRSVFQTPASTWFRKSMIVEIIASLLILLFIYAAFSKLSDYNRFSVQLSKSPFITSFSNIVAWSIPAIEILIALLLVIKRTRQTGLYASFFLMSLFTAYLLIMLNYSYYVPCSCGGVLENLSWESHIVFNTFFAVISGVGIFLNKNINT